MCSNNDLIRLALIERQLLKELHILSSLSKIAERENDKESLTRYVKDQSELKEKLITIELQMFLLKEATTECK